MRFAHASWLHLTACMSGDHPSSEYCHSGESHLPACTNHPPSVLSSDRSVTLSVVQSFVGRLSSRSRTSTLPCLAAVIARDSLFGSEGCTTFGSTPALIARRISKGLLKRAHWCRKDGSTILKGGAPST